MLYKVEKKRKRWYCVCRIYIKYNLLYLSVFIHLYCFQKPCSASHCAFLMRNKNSFFGFSVFCTFLSSIHKHCTLSKIDYANMRRGIIPSSPGPTFRVHGCVGWILVAGEKKFLALPRISKIFLGPQPDSRYVSKEAGSNCKRAILSRGNTWLPIGSTS